MENDMSVQVGKKIKYYRKKRNMSVEQLASKVFKGKSTFYKYENGTIPIDVGLLKDISQALNVPITNFLDIPESATIPPPELKYPFGNNTELYLYNYVNRTLIKSKMELNYNTDKGYIEATMYYNIPSFDHYNNCSYIYKGQMISFDFITYFIMVNNLVEAEHVTICAFNPWNQSSTTSGLLFGLLNFPLSPTACKILISTEKIEDNAVNLSDLTLSTDEIKRLKTYNMLYLNHIQEQ